LTLASAAAEALNLTAEIAENAEIGRDFCALRAFSAISAVED
jgi:hypothetical protein